MFKSYLRGAILAYFDSGSDQCTEFLSLYQSRAETPYFDLDL